MATTRRLSAAQRPVICSETGCEYEIDWKCGSCGRYVCGYHCAWRETGYQLCWPCHDRRADAGRAALADEAEGEAGE